MGIRFNCPNGHKLNVKQFQAGRQGVCPVCGVSMQIPLQSTRPSSRKKGSQTTPPDAITLSEVPDATVAREDRVATSHSPAPVAATGSSTMAGAPPAKQPQWDTPVDSTAAPPAATDPLSMAGDAVWFVRPPSGGQYGPATGPVMRSWLAEGRVSADALVWREGWPDWQEAGSVFRQLSPNLTIPELEKGVAKIVDVTTPVVVVDPASEAGRSHPPPGRAPKRNKQVIVVAWLTVAVVILLIIFFWVLMR